MDIGTTSELNDNLDMDDLLHMAETPQTVGRSVFDLVSPQLPTLLVENVTARKHPRPAVGPASSLRANLNPEFSLASPRPLKRLMQSRSIALKPRPWDLEPSSNSNQHVDPENSNIQRLGTGLSPRRVNARHLLRSLQARPA